MEIGNKFAGFCGWFGGLGFAWNFLQSPSEPSLIEWLIPVVMCFCGTCFWKYGFNFSDWFKKY